jgi:hypothetical protein
MTSEAAAGWAGRATLSGAIAGAFSALVFTAVHEWTISDIWNTLPIMLIAGAACGACIGWTYALTHRRAGVRTWAAYNALLWGLFALLGGLSEVIFTPVTTAAAVIAANESPDELISQAMPFILAFTVGAAALMTLAFGRRWRIAGPMLAMVAVLMVSLGMNVAIIGLVSFDSASLALVGKMFWLIGLLAAVHAALFAALERRRMGTRGVAAL